MGNNISTTDSFWKTYANRVQRYLDRPIFKDTPLNGQMLADNARASYEVTGMYVPPELVLAQAQRETKMGTVGRKHHRENPFNVGEYDNGTVYIPKSTNEGVAKYFNLIANNYLRGKTVDELTSNFVDNRGNRYASDKGYEKYLKNQMAFINEHYK